MFSPSIFPTPAEAREAYDRHYTSEQGVSSQWLLWDPWLHDAESGTWRGAACVWGGMAIVEFTLKYRIRTREAEE